MILNKRTFFGYILAIVIFIALALSFELVYDVSSAINSDLIYIESLYRDILIRDYPLNGWLVSKAPYFFPDWVAYCLIRAFSGNYATAWYLYIIFDFSFLLTFFYCTARYFHKKSGVEDLLFTLIWGALLILLLEFTPTGYGPHTLLLPVYHSGALINGLVILWVWYRSLLSTLNSKQLFFLMLFSTVASMSDLWWVVWFGVPIGLATLALLAARKLEWRGNIFFLCAMGIGVLSGELINRLIEWQAWLHFSHVPVGTPAYSFINQLNFIVRDVSDLLISSPLLAVLFFLTVGLCILAIISWGYQRRWRTLRPASLPQNKTDAFVAIHIVVILSFVVLFIPIVFLKMWEQWNYRYLPHFIVLPWVIVGLYLFDLRGRSARTKNISRLAYFLPFVAVLLLMTVAHDSSFQPSRRGISLAWLYPPYPQEIACIDEVARSYNLHFGISEYWDAKKISETSKTGLLVNQFTYNFDVLPWMNNDHWYKTKAPHKNGFIEYDFVITSSDTGSEVKKNTSRYLGSPSAEVVCGTWHVLIYEGDRKAQLNEFIGAKLAKFFNGDEGMSTERKNLLMNGDFELPNLKAWQYTAAQGIATFEQIPFGAEPTLIPGNPKYYARWKLNSPASYAFLEQHFDIKALAGKELALTFWAKVPSGKKEFSSHGYLVPQGLLDKTAVSFGPTSGSPFTINEKWQKIRLIYVAPPVTGLDISDGGYALIRPFFFSDASTPTVDIAHARLEVWGSLVPMEEAGTPPVALSEDVGQLIVNADKSHTNGKYSEEFRFLKQAETVTLKNPEILWRFARVHKQLAAKSASLEEEWANLRTGADYAFMAHNLITNSKTLEWWGIMAAELGRIEGTKQQNIGAGIFADFMTRAIALDPADAELQVLMGQWHFEWAAPETSLRLRSMFLFSSMPQGSFEKARDFFARAIELEPNNVLYRLWLAKTLIKLNNKTDAAKQLQAALRISANSNHEQSLMHEVQALLN